MVNDARAAFYVKKAACNVEMTTAPANAATVPAATAKSEYTARVDGSGYSSKKHSFFTRIAGKLLSPAKKEPISQVGYIVLAILGLGWLAMGINDNFQGYDWLISLLLYLIFYLPGLIFTLIMMSNYY